MIKKLFSPIIALTSIILITTLVVSMTFLVTQPRIESNSETIASSARKEVLPDADGFSLLSDVWLADNVTQVYSATNGVGYAITSTAGTNAGEITVITGLSLNGSVTGIRIIDAADGVPNKNVLVYADLYLEALKTDYAGTTRIDALLSDMSGNTYSASDVLGAVSAAIMQMDYLGGDF